MNDRNDQVILEGMTSLSALLNSSPVNDRKIQTVWIDEAKKTSRRAEIGFLRAKSAELGFGLEFVSKERIDSVATGQTSGWILGFWTDRTLPTLTEDKIEPNGFYVYLEGMEDPYNFGNALRSLYAAGVNGIVLPPRNWMSAAGVVARASAGTSERTTIYTCPSDTVGDLFHAAGYKILCAGIRDSVSIFDQDFPFPVLLVIGGEKRGISGKLLETADQIVRIDYGRAFRGSLSASSAAAVLAFEQIGRASCRERVCEAV